MPPCDIACTCRSNFDRQGFDKYGFDKYGYSRFGYQKEGYDEDGFDKYVAVQTCHQYQGVLLALLTQGHLRWPLYGMPHNPCELVPDSGSSLHAAACSADLCLVEKRELPCEPPSHCHFPQNKPKHKHFIDRRPIGLFPLRTPALYCLQVWL